MELFRHGALGSERTAVRDDSGATFSVEGIAADFDGAFFAGDGVERIGAALAALKVGPAIEDVDVGPLISPAALERALAAGGEPIHGLFVRPGIATAAIGPLVTVEPLGAELPQAPVVHIHAGDPGRAQRLALQLRAQPVFINGAGVPDPPFEALARTKRITELFRN